MTDRPTRHLTPEQARARRVALIADLDADTDDVATWRHTSGRPLTAWERTLLARCSEDEWEQALETVGMLAEVAANHAEQVQTYWVEHPHA
jgi:hypothetical protein